MASISTCPRCRAELMVHALDNPDEQLRCPSCAAIFQTREIISESREAPPMALPVEPALVGSLAGAMAGAMADVEAAATAHGERYESPAAESLPEDMDITGSAAEGAPVLDPEMLPAADSPMADAGELPAMAPNDGDALGAMSPESAARGSAPESETFGVAGAAPPMMEPELDVAPPPVDSGFSVSSSATTTDGSYAARRRAPPPRSGGSVGQLVGLVLGGVFGLVLGYVILVLLGPLVGRDTDFLKLKQKLFGGARSVSVEEEIDEQARRDMQRWMAAAASQSRTGAPPPEEEEEMIAPTLPAVASSTPAVVPKPDETSPQDNRKPSETMYGPKMVQFVDMAQLSAAMRAAHQALGCQACDSRGFVEVVATKEVVADDGRKIQTQTTERAACEACDGKPKPKVTLPAYEKLCELAQAVTYVDHRTADPSLAERRAAIATMLQRMSTEQGNAEIIGRLGGLRVDAASPAGPGIVLAGTIQESAPDGPLYRTTLVLLSSPKVVEVFSARPLPAPLGPRSKALILGSMVDGPGKNIHGYSGSGARVVWGGLAVPMPPPGA